MHASSAWPAARSVRWRTGNEKPADLFANEHTPSAGARNHPLGLVIDARRGGVEMKTQQHRIEDLQRRRFEADLKASINALFRRCPTLCGFTVRDAANL